MKNTFLNYVARFRQTYNPKAIRTLSITLLLIVGLPVSVFLVSRQTGLFSRASETPSIEAEDGINKVDPLFVGKDVSASSGEYIQFGGTQPSDPSINPAPTSKNETHFGWDYNLTHRCIRMGDPGTTNYYSDFTDCPVPGKTWGIMVGSGKGGEDFSCPGPGVQAFPINQPGSPVTLNWIKNPTNWTVNLKTDLINNTHPCGTGHYTFYVLDEAGPYPQGDKMLYKARVNYDDKVLNGGSRALIGFAVTPDNKISYEVEINMAVTNPSHWGYDLNNPSPLVAQFDFGENNFRHYFMLNGANLAQIGIPNITLTKGVDTDIQIDFNKIIQWMIVQGKFPALQAGQKWQTNGVYVGTEAVNYSRNNAVLADFYITNYQLESL